MGSVSATETSQQARLREQTIGIGGVRADGAL